MTLMTIALAALLQASAPAAAIAADAPSQARRELEQSVLTATNAFFAARDSGRYAEAYRMFGSELASDVSEAEFRQTVGRMRSEWGAIRSRRNVAVTIYTTPPGAPEQATYALVDFTAQYEKLYFLCGHVTWARQDDGTWRIAHLMESAFPHAQSPGASAAEIVRARSIVRCRD